MKLSNEATEVTRLWKFIYENKGIFGSQTGITAEMALEKAPPPPVLSAPTAKPVATKPQATSAAAATPSAPAASAAPSRKETPAKSQQAVPCSNAEALAKDPPSTACAARAAPPTAGSPVAVVSFPSTGDATRDGTVAALHQVYIVVSGSRRHG
jgi:hypothetical protein